MKESTGKPAMGLKIKWNDDRVRGAMTDVTATVKVRSSDGSGEKPERERVERAAELLKESGFAIQRLGRLACLRH